MTSPFRSTTILAVRRGASVAMAGDGQVSLGPSIVKASAAKVRKIADGQVIAGFAGASADAFALLERFEAKWQQQPGGLARAAVELAKDWRTDRILRRLEAMIIVLDKQDTFLVSGTGDVIAPDDGVIAIGSGGNYALAAARALMRHTELDASTIAREGLRVASELCVYTNDHIHVETL